MFPTKQKKSFLSLFEPRAAIETGVIYQDTYFSYMEVGTFCMLFPKKTKKQIAHSNFKSVGLYGDTVCNILLDGFLALLLLVLVVYWNNTLT